MKFRIGRDAGGGARFQFVEEEGMGIGPLGVFRSRHFIVGERIFQRALAEFGQVGQGREDNIGGDAVELGRAAGDAVEFLDG